MEAATASLHRRGPHGLPSLSARPRRGWLDGLAHADFCAVADFNRWRFAITVVPLAQIAAATPEHLCVKRACTAPEFFAFTCSSAAARSYTDAGGILRNDLAIDQMRKDWVNGRLQLALNGQITNLWLNSAVGATQNISVATNAYALSFYGTGTITLTGASTAGPLVGTGTNDRVSIGIWTTAGTLTCTVSGDVRMVQLEQMPLPGAAQATAQYTLPTAYIPTGASAVTRAIESARLSPVLEAVLQRSAASILVRGQNAIRNAGRIVGTVGTNGALMQTGGNTVNQRAVNGGTPSLSTVNGPMFRSTSWAMALGYDGTGRSIVCNGAALVEDAVPIQQDRSMVYLGRDNAAAPYGDGWYDFVAIAPTRLANAYLSDLAVPAP